MIRSVLISLVLSALLIFVVLRVAALFETAAPERVTRIDIYSDTITYRMSRYPTPSRLAIGLKAVNDPPRLLAVHDCERMEVLEAVLQVVREQGYTSFEVQLPDDC
jgi:hypothetical protein